MWNRFKKIGHHRSIARNFNWNDIMDVHAVLKAAKFVADSNQPCAPVFCFSSVFILFIFDIAHGTKAMRKYFVHILK